MAEIMLLADAKDGEDGRRYIELEGGLRVVTYKGRIEGWYFCEKDPFEELLKAEHRAEVFERMAFVLKEERDMLLEISVRCTELCEHCSYGGFHDGCDECDCDCSVCKDEGCICRHCEDGSCFFAKAEE